MASFNLGQLLAQVQQRKQAAPASLDQPWNPAQLGIPANPNDPWGNFNKVARDWTIPVHADQQVQASSSYDPSSGGWTAPQPGEMSTNSGSGQALDDLIKWRGTAYAQALFENPAFRQRWEQQYPGTSSAMYDGLIARNRNWANNDGPLKTAAPAIMTAAGAGAGAFLGDAASAAFEGGAHLGGGASTIAGAGAGAIPASAAGVGVEGGTGALTGAAAPAATSYASDATLQQILDSVKVPNISDGVNVADLGNTPVQMPDASLGSGIKAGATNGTVGGGELGGGVTPGTTAGGIGGGALGTGLAAGAAGATGTALAQGSFASENAYPVPGGQSGAAAPSPVTTGATSAATSSALSRILDGTASTADWTSILGTAGATGLGIYGANEQANKLKEIADRYYATGAPSRARYEGSFDPNFKVTDIPGYSQALDTTTDTLLRKASPGGNPAGNPSVLSEIAKYVTGNVALPTIQNYRTQNANTGGYSSFNTAAPTTATNAINAGGNVYGDLGYGIGQATNPRPQISLSDIMRGLA